MRYIVIVFLLAGLFISVAPVSALDIYDQGVYEFEETVLGMTYSGTWSTTTVFGNLARRTTTGSSQVRFQAEGGTLVIWRRMVQSTGNSMYVCIGVLPVVPCVTVTNDTTTATYWQPVRFDLPTGVTADIFIQQIGGIIDLDYFMILADADIAAGMPTAVPTVPTATILPSSTPAFTATPQPTSTPGNTPVPTATILPSSTPAPTATPYTLPESFYALDPAARYDTVNGQITVTRYEMRAADYISMFLMGVLVIVNLVAVGLTIWKRK